MAHQTETFGPFTFDHATASLSRDGVKLPLGGRSAALLAALLKASAKVVSKQTLMQSVWPDLAIEEGNLAVQITNLRKALGLRPDGQEWIVNVARVGYRLNFEAATSPTAAVRPSFAILPFANMTNDPAQDYFADGIVEDMITAFSRFKNIAVVARQSSFAYKNRAIDIRDVARELGVNYVLEGSVRRANGHVRVTAQLIDGSSGAHLWAGAYDAPVAEIFDMQDQITQTVVGIVEPQILSAEFERVRRKRPENLDAYDFYLKALHLIAIGKKGTLDAGIELLDQSIALDPTFAQALAQAARLYQTRWSRSRTAPDGNPDAQRAVALAARALTADGNDALVLALAGMVQIIIKGEVSQGFALVKQAMELNPNNVLIVNCASYTYWFRNDFDNAIACNQRALGINPASPDRFWALLGMARVHLAAGRPEEALLWALRSVEVKNHHVQAHCLVTACYAHLGQLDEARAELAVVLKLDPTLTVETAVDPGPLAGDVPVAKGLALAGLRLTAD